MNITLTDEQIAQQKIRPVDVLRDLPSGHLKKGAKGILALHKMRVFRPLGDGQYQAIEMDGQLFEQFFRDPVKPDPILIVPAP